MDVDEIRSEHVGHVESGCELFMKTCPICSIIVDEQSDRFLSMIEESFYPILADVYERWHALGYSIANATTSEILTSTLALTAYTRWISPKYEDIEVDDCELKKIARMVNG
jgi:hypothetical protein